MRKRWPLLTPCGPAVALLCRSRLIGMNSGEGTFGRMGLRSGAYSTGWTRLGTPGWIFGGAALRLTERGRKLEKLNGTRRIPQEAEIH
jgi:hypothetical protein